MNKQSSYVSNEPGELAGTLNEKTRKHVEVESILPQRNYYMVEISKVEKIFEDDLDKKEASVLDYPQSNLCSEIWDTTSKPPKLKVTIRKEIIEHFDDILESQNTGFYIVKGMYFVGSLTTQQYTEESDLDIHVVVPENFVEMLTKILLDTPEETLSNTKHPIQYYVEANRDPLRNVDAIYDVLNNEWIKEPQTTGFFDPSEKYKDVFEHARFWANKIDLEEAELKRDVMDYDTMRLLLGNLSAEGREYLRKKIEEKVSEVEKDIGVLVLDLETVKKLRLLAFEEDIKVDESNASDYISRNILPANVIYKYLEKYRYLKLLRQLKILQRKELENGELVSEVKKIVNACLQR